MAERKKIVVPKSDIDKLQAVADHLGIDCDIIGVNDGTKQVADIGTSSTNVLRIVGGTEGSAEVLVNIILHQVAQI